MHDPGSFLMESARLRLTFGECTHHRRGGGSAADELGHDSGIEPPGRAVGASDRCQMTRSEIASNTIPLPNHMIAPATC